MCSFSLKNRHTQQVIFKRYLEKGAFLMTSRTERLRSRLYRNPPEICLDRARLYTDRWLETEGKPLVVRRAMALAKVLKEMTIYIEDEELVVGNHASRAFSVPLFPEFSVSWFADEMDSFKGRTQDAFILREEDRRSSSDCRNVARENAFRPGHGKYRTFPSGGTGGSLR